MTLQKVSMKEKRIVNVDMVYIVNHVKVNLNAKGITFHVFAFSGEKITSIAQAARANMDGVCR